MTVLPMGDYCGQYGAVFIGTNQPLANFWGDVLSCNTRLKLPGDNPNPSEEGWWSGYAD